MVRRELLMLPGPTNVPERVMEAMQKPIINHRGPAFRELMKGIIANLKKVFQTQNDVFVLTSSGTGGVECAVSNIVFPGAKVIVPVNGVFSSRLKDAVEMFGGEAIEIPVPWNRAPSIEEIKGAVEQNRDATAVAVVFNETSTGVTTRIIKEIGDLCASEGMLSVVDAISILGGDELPVDEWKVDICITGSQKCLMCPPGLAIVSVSQKAWDVIKKARRSYYFDLIAYKKFMERWETPFTPAIPLFYALDEALKMIVEEGLKARVERHRLCAKALYEATEAMGLEPYPEDYCRSNTVVAIKAPKGLRASEIAERMARGHGVHIAEGMGKLRDEVIRIGIMGAVSKNEVLATVRALEATLEGLGLRLAGSGLQAAEEAFSGSY